MYDTNSQTKYGLKKTYLKVAVVRVVKLPHKSPLPEGVGVVKVDHGYR